jgi:major membrane immunogen (membrane-anchored lipoprotein)
MKRILLLAVCSSLLTACGKQDKAGVEGPTGNVEDDFVCERRHFIRWELPKKN